MTRSDPHVPLAPEAVCAVTTTVASPQDAERLAQVLLQHRLAACVQIEPITSHYHWQGALHADAEWRLVCKTTPEAVPRLLACLQQEHPYALPQLLVQPVQASQAYADWVHAQTAQPGL
ncbi:divalent-cation tolerance protein CutA [Comamonas granuli]|uniref:divalent-cation tolerance protein CutA n=1 Tax=Comamonas granuli TaxID=290309 RepID=UPI0005A60EB2|nr:divalent-cation tolerance protein CutA [Comamonas granuli]